MLRSSKSSRLTDTTNIMDDSGPIQTHTKRRTSRWITTLMSSPLAVCFRQLQSTFPSAWHKPSSVACILLFVVLPLCLFVQHVLLQLLPQFFSKHPGASSARTMSTLPPLRNHTASDFCYNDAGTGAHQSTVMYAGTGLRVQRILTKAMRGQPVVISVIGGSGLFLHLTR